MECQVIIERAARFLWLPFEAANMHAQVWAVESTSDEFSEI
jgi:hypothetical protein